MSKHVVIKMRKINNVKGNIQYLSSKTEHPETCITYSTCSKKQWFEYAEFNQKEFEASGKVDKGKCVEAREAILVLPQEFYKLDKESRIRYARIIANKFKDKYGAEVMVALHAADKENNNMHIHLMFMERKKVAAHEKIADRRLYFDDRGRQVKSKKYAVDEEGNLLPGYSFVRKGESYGGTKEWTSKDQFLHSNGFTHQLKEWWADELNLIRKRDWAKEMEHREVYDPETSPYLPLQEEYKPFRYSNLDKQIESNQKAYDLSYEIGFSNHMRREYNEKVDEALKNGANREELVEKRKKIYENIKQALKSSQTSKINEILAEGIEMLEKLVERLRTAKESLKNVIADIEKEKIENKPSNKLNNKEFSEERFSR